MPTVIIRRDPVLVADTFISQLVSALPEVVADSLTVPGTDCEVMGSDVGIEVRDHGPLDKPTHDLEVTIWAGRHEQRSRNLEQRRLVIQGAVQTLLGAWSYERYTPSGFVWILLVEDAFGELN